MRLLIYGAGVIGSLYAVLLRKAGFDVSVYARGRRLAVLKSRGLLYYENNKLRQSKVKVLKELKRDDKYDFIFLTVRENQLYAALEELKYNNSDIVTMVNSIDDYRNWEDICGKGRIIPAFPGAGGSIRNDILDASLTPSFVQPTTFGKISREKTVRINKLAGIFKKAKIPYKIADDMHLWQICHLAMVVPIADAYYEAKYPQRAGYEHKLMLKTAKRLKRNFNFIKLRHGRVLPRKLNIFLYAPTWLLATVIAFIFRSSFAYKFMYRHSMKAKDEMKNLHKQLYAYMKSKF
jgi:ketopantoate reductase apbA/panE domain protein